MKIKRSISFTEKSLKILNKIQKSLDDTSISTIFEAGVKKFYEIGRVKIDLPENDKEKRITIYLDESTNAQLNELAFIYDKSFKDIANIIVDKIYG